MDADRKQKCRRACEKAGEVGRQVGFERKALDTSVIRIPTTVLFCFSPLFDV